jgi:energy-coupling factor transporter ATP-binding protein EcfA2
VITATELELRAGSRLLLADASFHVGPGDRTGLVGRNGAGKTTLTRVLAGEALPAAGTVTRTGPVGYLPQDPRTGDLDVQARDRILSARGLDDVMREMRATELAMASADGGSHDAALRRYGRLDSEFLAAGGYAAESAAACPNGYSTSHSAHCPAGNGVGSSSRASCSRLPATVARCCWMSRPITSTQTPSPGYETSCGHTAAGWSSSATMGHFSSTP